VNLNALVPLPARSDINTGLSPATQYTMIHTLGVPGKPTRDCGPITNQRLRSQIFHHQFNNFGIEGWRPGVELFKRAMDDVYHEDRELHASIGTAGMLCCRLVRGGSNMSNHSWGTAIDITINGKLIPLGSTVCYVGLLKLYRYMHRYGFYWSAGLPGRKDAMHFELAEQMIVRLYRQYYGAP